MEKNNTITLELSKKNTCLAGNRFGNDIFTNQIADKMNYSELNVIILPDHIEDIASSFIEGLYENVTEKYGKVEALDIMQLVSNNSEAQEKINDCIETFGV